MTTTSQRLFHLAPPVAFRLALASEDAAWSPPSLESEGFIHLSFAEQLRGTLNAHFAGHPAVLLLEVRATGLGDDLRLEASRGGALFPHLYRALCFDEFERTWALERSSGGWMVPSLGTAASDDFPAGAPLDPVA